MRGALLALLLLCAPPAAALTCQDRGFEGARYTTCEVGPDDDLRLFLNGADGAAYGSFAAVDAALSAQGQRLGFAMNAGMFHRDLAPVGLYVEGGIEHSRLITRAGPGNFGLLPNGVFCIAAGQRAPKGAQTLVAEPPRFAVLESRHFGDTPRGCTYATQSGPMLVIAGQLHPRFLPESDSLNIRNGVGVSADGQRAVFAITADPVNFHAFARFFRDALGLPDALYLDGSISRLYAPQLDRHDGGFPMGPMLGTVEPKG